VLCLCVRRPEADSDAAAGRVPSGPWQLLGVDCEMCATAVNDKELLQVAVVDEDDTLLMQVRRRCALLRSCKLLHPHPCVMCITAAHAGFRASSCLITKVFPAGMHASSPLTASCADAIWHWVEQLLTVPMVRPHIKHILSFVLIYVLPLCRSWCCRLSL
jgi:hypothetical protein